MRKAPPPKTVDEYLADVSEPARSTLEKIRATIWSAVPEGTVEVISYGMPIVKYKGMLVAYAAFKNHCSFFGLDSTVLDEFKEELKAYPKSKGTVRFPMDKPPPARIIKKLVKARVARNEARFEARAVAKKNRAKNTRARQNRAAAKTVKAT
jgi:uncharacterized protein YdhG (YjbR/CyaY superfamily)